MSNAWSAWAREGCEGPVPELIGIYAIAHYDYRVMQSTGDVTFLLIIAAILVIGTLLLYRRFVNAIPLDSGPP